MADYFLKDHKPSARQGEARLRGLYRIIYSTPLSPRLCAAKPTCAGYGGLCIQRPSALGSALRSPPAWAIQFNLQRSTFNVQPSTFNLQRSTFNLQPPSTTFNVQPSTFNLQPPSTFNLQPSTTFNVQPSIFNLQPPSTFNLQPSTFNHLQPSTFNHLQPSPFRAQRRLCPGRLRSRAGWNGSRGEDPPQFWCHSRAR
jgi:hypothetical protein